MEVLSARTEEASAAHKGRFFFIALFKTFFGKIITIQVFQVTLDHLK